MKNRTIKAILIFLLIIAPVIDAAGSSADAPWRSSAFIEVIEPGPVEAMLPPGLHFRSGDNATGQQNSASDNLDLNLKGPDGNSRPFMMFWREKSKFLQSRMQITGLTFSEKQGEKVLLIEGTPVKTFHTNRIRINIASKDFISSVDIEGKNANGWQTLIEKAAVYQSGSLQYSDINIRQGLYTNFRMYFRGYDKKFNKRLVPVKSITAFGKLPGKDYVETTIPVSFRRIVDVSDTSDVSSTSKDSAPEKSIEDFEVKAVLPGTGIWIKSLSFTTQAQFQGDYKISREVVESGIRVKKQVLSGNKISQGENQQTCTIDINKKWPGSLLFLTLDSSKLYFGKIIKANITVRLPRMVFHADKAGTYEASTGTEHPAAVLDFSPDIAATSSKTTSTMTPGSISEDGRNRMILFFSHIKKNHDWQPASLIESFSIKGGPFESTGYQWKSLVDVPKPGYYRVTLNHRAGLEDNQDGFRMVRNDMQIPYFRGRLETRQIKPDVDFDYDRENNSTTWDMILPQSSSCWSGLELRSSGIFKRTLKLEHRTKRPVDWQTWKQLAWQNSLAGEAILEISLNRFPKNLAEIRLVMDHEDNSPIDLTAVTAKYYTRDIFFIAHEKGPHELFGGNPDAPRPSYDLALIQHHLLETESMPIKLDNITALSGPGLSARFNKLFTYQGWGLYIVLGIVTMILLVLIVKMFPKENKE